MEPAKSSLRRWLSRRKAREAAHRAELAARHAAVVDRLDVLERQVRQLDETLTKQLGELEPRLLHAFELRAAGLERELGGLLRSAAPAPRAEPPPPVWESLGVARLAALGLLALSLGIGLGRACAG